MLRIRHGEELKSNEFLKILPDSKKYFPKHRSSNVRIGIIFYSLCHFLYWISRGYFCHCFHRQSWTPQDTSWRGQSPVCEGHPPGPQVRGWKEGDMPELTSFQVSTFRSRHASTLLMVTAHAVITFTGLVQLTLTPYHRAMLAWPS